MAYIPPYIRIIILFLNFLEVLQSLILQFPKTNPDISNDLRYRRRAEDDMPSCPSVSRRRMPALGPEEASLPKPVAGSTARAAAEIRRWLPTRRCSNCPFRWHAGRSADSVATGPRSPAATATRSRASGSWEPTSSLRCPDVSWGASPSKEEEGASRLYNEGPVGPKCVDRRLPTSSVRRIFTIRLRNCAIKIAENNSEAINVLRFSK